MTEVEYIKHYFLVFTMILPRIMACFSVIAFFSRGVMGSVLIRNGVIFALAIFLIPAVEPLMRDFAFTPLSLLAIIIKEAVIGFLIGFTLNIPFLTIESVGSIIDNQRGASIMSSLNFLSGSEASALGILFTQGAVVIFMISGGFYVFLKGFYLSYSLWTLTHFWPRFELSSTAYFIEQFSLIMQITVLLGAPIIMALFLSEWGLALVNRFAPQLNVFFLSMSIKSAVGFLVLYIYFGTMMQHYQDLFFSNDNLVGHIMELLK